MKTRLLFFGFTIVAAGAILILAGASPRSQLPASHQREAEQKQPPLELSGEKARQYLEETGDGQSLMAAVTTARFGLQRQEHPPFDEKSGAGYLGMSHDQNLYAWFGEEGVTVRPTVPEDGRAQAWQMAFRAKAYGYGEQLADVPPVTARNVNGTRIEYERQNQKSEIRNQRLVEWYENRAEGIEQGFTLHERPERSGAVGAEEPLRVTLEVTGDLRARVKDEGQQIELIQPDGKGALSYSKLIAEDADGKKLAARMEASADGREIALVVEDAGARYPIVIDPIVASLEKKLEAFTAQQAEARFGAAVAIDGNRAVVGAWREDSGGIVDVGVVYTFSRSGNTWTLSSRNDSGDFANDACGWSVAISGSRIVYGCPGVDGNTGRANIRNTANGVSNNFNTFNRAAGDRYGASVAFSGDIVVVGAPANDFTPSQPDTGAFHVFRVDTSLTVYELGSVYALSIRLNAQLGAAVAVEGNTIVAGAPGCEPTGGCAGVYILNSNGSPVLSATLIPINRSAGDNFGNSVNLSGNTAVVGAWGDDDRGTDAGAAYVFVRDTSGGWSQQQKLLASDGRAGDGFSINAVAIEGNMIVVGAYAQDGFSSSPDPERGAAYIFTRRDTAWTEQTSMRGESAGDQFGISVGLSNDTVIAGARGATAFGTARAGAAYVYRLDCVPPQFADARVGTQPQYTTCPGYPVPFTALGLHGTAPRTYQWRKNGVNISGATSKDYTINEVRASDAGSYDVIVSNACGSATSTAATLTVHSFSINPTSQNFGAGGSNGIINVATNASCPWAAQSNAPWINITSNGSGVGNGTVGFSVAATDTQTQRTGTISIGYETFTATQDGLNCSYAVTPTEQSFGATGGASSVNVGVTAGCAWSATSNAPFITVNGGAGGTGNGVTNYSVAANHSPTQRTGTLTVAGRTVTVTQAGAPLLGNISTRLRVEQGDNALIGGFIITGNESKRLMLRAIGPSLPVEGALADPQLQLFNSSGEEIAFNNNWRDATNRQEIIDSTIAPGNDLESAILGPLAPGAYTAVVRGVGDSTGVGLVEAYDLGQTADAKLANISTRGLVQTGDNVMIGGFIVLGTSQKLIVRALGPSLPVNGKLNDPLLEIYNGNGDQIAVNNNWRETQQADINATGIPPAHDLESAIVGTVGPDAYTAIVRGVNETGGVALVEVYALD